jgi:hypothetical protein
MFSEIAFTLAGGFLLFLVRMPETASVLLLINAASTTGFDVESL